MSEGHFNATIETLPPAEMAELQLTELRRQLAYVSEASPFYRRKFAAAGFAAERVRTLADLRHAPFTTKDELRESQLAAPPLGEHAAVPLGRVVRVLASSGTTGRPSYIGITRHDRAMWTEMASRALYAGGARPGDRLVLCFNLGIFVSGLICHDALEDLGATLIPIGTGASDRVLAAMQHVGADGLLCTPSYATYLADYVRQRGVEPRALGVRKILGGAEPGIGIPTVRQQIEETWQCVATETLGNADMAPILFGECLHQTGMHQSGPDFVLIELIDPDTGDPVPMEDEASGEIVYTALKRECVPLVRFRTRDRVVVWTSPCPCGRTGMRLRCVGRTDDMLIVLGVNVFPSAIRDVLASLRPRTTGEVQILLDRPGPKVEPPLRLRVEAGPAAGDLEDLQRLAEGTLHERLLARFSAEIVPEGSLPRFEMKARLIRKLYEE